MTSHRPYHENRKGRTPAWAFGEVEKQAGSQFDPKCAAAFLAMRELIVRAMLDLMPGTEVDEPFIQPVNPAEASLVEEYVPDPRN
jgi:HD-GYP domain-containing protein (c-di-GMP phosphodiesterase class II)